MILPTTPVNHVGLTENGISIGFISDDGKREEFTFFCIDDPKVWLAVCRAGSAGFSREMGHEE